MFPAPFGLVDSIRRMTPIIVIFISYTFMALDAIVNEIEEPFGLAPNDLALNAMSKTIETTLREMIGEDIETPAENKTLFQPLFHEFELKEAGPFGTAS